MRRGWVQCGPCDFGLVEFGCNCPTGDYRPVLLRAVNELEEARERVDELAVHSHREYGNGYRDSAAFIDGYLANPSRPVDSGAALARVREALLDQARSIFAEVDRAAAGAGTGNPGMEVQPPPTPDQTEVPDEH